MHIIRIISIVTLLLTQVLASVANAEPVTTETRTSTSIINGEIVESEYPPVPNAVGNTASEIGSPRKLRTILHNNHGLWIYDLLINLSADNDADGHYSAFSITLDIDNSFNPREVYAVFYLSQNHGLWFEYAVTGNFTVSGNSGHDSVSIDTSLESGYPSDYYDLYTEIYDAHTGALLLTYGPDNSAQLANIPFESEYDDHYYHDTGPYVTGQSSVSVQLSFSGGGSFPWLTLLFFASLLSFRTYKRHAQTSISRNTSNLPHLTTCLTAEQHCKKVTS